MSGLGQTQYVYQNQAAQAQVGQPYVLGTDGTLQRPSSVFYQANPGGSSQVLVPVNSQGQMVAPIGYNTGLNNTTPNLLSTSTMMTTAPTMMNATPTMMNTTPTMMNTTPTMMNATPTLMNTTPMLTTTTPGMIGNIPVIQQRQDEDNFSLASYVDPRKQSSAGVLKGSTLGWLTMALTLVNIIVHSCALGLPYWTWIVLQGSVNVYFGIWQVCDSVVACQDPASYNVLRTYFSTSDHDVTKALSIIVLVGLVICFILILVFLMPTPFKKQLHVAFLLTTIITIALMIALIAFWEVNFRLKLTTVGSKMGASFILELVALGLTFIMLIVATIDFFVITKKL